VWVDLGPTPGFIQNSQAVVIPGIPYKILVPLTTYIATTTPAQVFNTDSKLWETPVSSSPILLGGACAFSTIAGA